jgi:hypothetical protein
VWDPRYLFLYCFGRWQFGDIDLTKQGGEAVYISASRSYTRNNLAILPDSGTWR